MLHKSKHILLDVKYPLFSQVILHSLGFPFRSGESGPFPV